MKITNDKNLLKEYQNLFNFNLENNYLNLDNNLIIDLDIKVIHNKEINKEISNDLKMIVKRLDNFYQLRSFFANTTLIKSVEIKIKDEIFQKIKLEITLERIDIYYNCSIKINNNVFIKDVHIKDFLNYLFNICLEEESNLFPFKEIGLITLKYAPLENRTLKNIDCLELSEESLFFDAHEFYGDFKIYLTYQELN